MVTRTHKYAGSVVSLAVDGENYLNTFFVERADLYPNQFITVSSYGQYTKHYFAHDRRVTSRVGEALIDGRNWHYRALRIHGVICLLLIMICAACGNDRPISQTSKQVQEKSQKTKHSLRIFHVFENPAGAILGYAYTPKDSDNDIFDRLYVFESKNSRDTLYKVERTKLYNQNGLEVEVSENDFHGYKCVIKRDDYIVLVMVDAQGREYSDNITIEWDYESKKFQLQQGPLQ